MIDPLSSWTFFIYFLIAIVNATFYALAGSFVMGIFHLGEKFYLDGKVTKKQYLWALGASFIFGLLMQWHSLYQDHQKIKTGVSNKLLGEYSKNIQELRNDLQDKEILIQDLRRTTDSLSIKSTTDSKSAALEIKRLERQLKEKERVIASLRVLLEDKKKKKEVCRKIGTLIEEGNILLKQTRNENLPPPKQKAELWAQRVETLLEKELGHSFVVRFRNRVGLNVPQFTTIQSEKHLKLWTALFIRLARLDEFSQKPCQ